MINVISFNPTLGLILTDILPNTQEIVIQCFNPTLGLILTLSSSTSPPYSTLFQSYLRSDSDTYIYAH